MSAKPDYTVTVGAVEYGLTNQGEGRYDWSGSVPLCEVCREPLTAWNEGGPSPAIHAKWAFEEHVTCDACGWQSARIEGVN